MKNEIELKKMNDKTSPEKKYTNSTKILNSQTQTKQNEEEENIILEEGELLIDEFDEKCEQHFRIKKVIPLEKSCCKFTLFVILNICTVGIINLFIMWFPKLELGLKYSRCPLLQATKIGVEGTDGHFYVVDIKHMNLPNIENSPLKQFCSFTLGNSNIVTYFTFKLFNYVFYSDSNSFKCFQFSIKNTQENIIEHLTEGLNPIQIEHQKMLFGICDLIVLIPSVLNLLITEFSDPFYLFQLFAVILWYCSAYEAYASVIIVATVVSLATAVYESRVNLLQIQTMARYACKVQVIRKDGEGNKIEETKMSTELVPGDLFEIPEDGYALPCDCILVNGTVIVNESMLTGESTPITKNHMQSIKTVIDLDIESKHTLFAGTKIVQKRAHGNQRVMGIVYKIGFDTVKGNLIRSILYPKEINSNLNQ